MEAESTEIRICFWNVHKRDLTQLVCAIASSSKVDVFVLIENLVTANDTLQALKRSASSDYFIPLGGTSTRIQCFCRNKLLDMSVVHSGNRISVRKLSLVPGGLLAIVHGVDIRNYDPASRQSVAQSLADDLRFVKQQQGTNRLIVIGDFNLNPFDSGMNLAAGLNALMTRECVSPGIRRFNGKEYELYYNPMWSLFRDNTEGPPGTVYDTSSQGTYGWSMLDQVLVNHSMVRNFRQVQILTHAGPFVLMNRMGRPDSKHASDHFPLLVDFW